MRSVLAGIILLLLTTSIDYSQLPAKGEVESIGFGSVYRPECWTPMVVKLWPQTSNTAVYVIQVVQEDLDRDRVLFERKVTLTGNSEGQGVREQRYWMYFIPEPNPKGVLAQQNSLTGLTAHLKVFLCKDNSARTQITQLPITSTIKPVDDAPSVHHRGHRIILMVADADAGDQIIRPEYEPAGVLEENLMVAPLRPADLPENVLGYEAVDAVVMLNVDPDNLKIPTDERMKALKEYVREGGNLVLCQTPQWEKMTKWGDLLPVTYPRYGTDDNPIQGVADRAELEPLKTWSAWKDDVNSRNKPETKSYAQLARESHWSLPKGPFKVGLAQPRPGTMVEQWISWPKEAGVGENYASAYLARCIYGAGGVTYVGQDLGDPAITGKARLGWENIWEKVMGWKDDVVAPSLVGGPPENEAQKRHNNEDYGIEGVSVADLGRPLLHGMDHNERGAALISLAILFFIVYWVAAAPVSYFVLAGKGKASLSWFVFAGSAIVATVLTALVVKAALSGAPQVRHVSFVRMAAGQPAVVWSRIGLYIPRDGPQTIELKDTAPDAVSYVAPYAMHPAYTQENEYPAYMEYAVPVQDATSSAPSIAVPYRRTLKKMETKWVGDLGRGIDGHVKVSGLDQQAIAGKVTNGTGKTLKNVYITYRYIYRQLNDNEVPPSRDVVLYEKEWKPTDSIDLAKAFNAPMLNESSDYRAEPTMEGVRELRSWIDFGAYRWDTYWARPLRGHSNIGMSDENAGALDYNEAIPRWFPMLSLFDRLPPVKAVEKSRVDLLRRGARNVDLSVAELAGGMLILAETDDVPLPFGFQVDGQVLGGEANKGKTFYQFVLPIEREMPKPATTQEGTE